MNFFDLGHSKYFFKKKKILKKISNFKNNKYWEQLNSIVDPDNKKRDLSKEEKKKTNDLKTEISFIKKKFKNKKKIKIIDLGSGLGFFLKQFSGKKYDKHSVEVSKVASVRSKNWSTVHHLDLQKEIKQDIGKFDVVFSYHVIEHLKKPNIFLLNVQKLLKKNGIFILGTPNFDSGCARHFNKNYRFYHDKTHISYFSENSLFRFLDDYGFKTMHVDYPFFDTEHFSIKNFKRLFDNSKISPPFYGNIMTFYCKKKSKKNIIKNLNYKKNLLRIIYKKY